MHSGSRPQADTGHFENVLHHQIYQIVDGLLDLPSIVQAHCDHVTSGFGLGGVGQYQMGITSQITAHPFFTIGHSTRSVEEFVHLLNLQEIRLVADVRIIPRSRTNPQYNAAKLADALAGFGIGYEHIARLGGLRRKTPDVPTDVNAFWEHKSFHNYADYAMTEEFRCGLVRLRALGNVKTTAIMCAEAVWWRCHRRIITDYLIAAGETVFHILGTNQVAQAHLTTGAVLKAGGTLCYPAP